MKDIVITLGIYLFFALIIFTLSVHDCKKRSKINFRLLSDNVPQFNMSKIQKILRKIFFPILLYVLILLWLFATIKIEGLALMTTPLVYLWVFPLYSFKTTNILFKYCKWRFIWSVIPPLSLSISFFCLFVLANLPASGAALYCAIIFAWCEIWSLLGTICPKAKNKNGNENDCQNTPDEKAAKGKQEATCKKSEKFNLRWW